MSDAIRASDAASRAIVQIVQALCRRFDGMFSVFAPIGWLVPASLAPMLQQLRATLHTRCFSLRPALCGAAGCLWLLVGCSAVVDSDKSKLGALPIPCEPGATASCPCRDGSMSVQACNQLARYDACRCGTPRAGVPAAGTTAGRGGAAGATLRPIAGR